MKSHAILPHRSTPGAVRKGTILAFDREGVPLVRTPELPTPVSCDLLDTGMGIPEYQLGQAVLFIVYPENSETGCILGVVTTIAAAGASIRRHSLKFEVDEFSVNARVEASIQTDGARVRLNREGDLEFLARTLVSRARRLQKFLAPILRLN